METIVPSLTPTLTLALALAAAGLLAAISAITAPTAQRARAVCQSAGRK